MAAARTKGSSSSRHPSSSSTNATSYTSTSYSSSSQSSASYYPSSCSSISPPRNYYHHHLNTASPPSRRSQPNEHSSAREHLASLIRKHGPPTPVSSSSSLRKLTSTSPINTSFLPSDSVETPPASPAPCEEPYESFSGSRPIPIPRAHSRSFEDLPLTPLTGRFDHQYLAERPVKDPHSSSGQPHHSRNEKTARKKKSQQTSVSVSETTSTTHRRSHSKKPPMSGPSLTMSHPSGPASPKPTPKDSPMYLGNLPRFHPAVYQSPNSTPSASLSPNTPNHHPRSFGYRVASGGGGNSREALRQYRELVAASVSLSRNGLSSSDAEISAPRLDPLGSPGPVTPLTLEEAESYLSTRSSDYASPRQADGERERHGTQRVKDTKGR